MPILHPGESAAQFWLRHAFPPLSAFLLLAFLFAATQADLTIANTWFFDAAHHRWLASGAWWANELIHTGGGWMVRATIVGALLLWIAGFSHASTRKLQRAAGFFFIATVLTVSIVGALKASTNVNCPWDLQPFGGHFPYIELFSRRPNALRAAHCFPAAHAGSGYAFMALYFVGYELGRRWALTGLATGLVLGVVFGLAQQARGAHFASHDLWSAFIAWVVPLSVYVFAFKRRLYANSSLRPAGR